MNKAASIGLVLTGGGARAAYQVGVLKAISDMMPDLHYPFRIICGTSAGAINAAGLAGGDSIFRHNIAHLERLWRELRVHHVYRSDAFGMTRWLTRFVQGILRGKTDNAPVSILDNSPLREFLAREVRFDMLTRNIEAGYLDAVGVTACGYTGGQSICFFQSRGDIPSWNQGQRMGVHCKLDLDHLMASSAIPTLFPPVRINREYFGDGATRQMAHISPVLHLGADRVLVIGVSANRICPPVRRKVPGMPSIAQVMEHVFNGMFLDTIEYDIDRLLLLNQLLTLIPHHKLEEAGLGHLRPVKLLEISPSQPMDDLAARYIDSLPVVLRRLIGRSQEMGGGGTSLASYLLFEPEFSSTLISLGYADAQAHAKQLAQFFADDQEGVRVQARTGS